MIEDEETGDQWLVGFVSEEEDDKERHAILMWNYNGLGDLGERNGYEFSWASFDCDNFSADTGSRHWDANKWNDFTASDADISIKEKITGKVTSVSEPDDSYNQNKLLMSWLTGEITDPQ